MNGSSPRTAKSAQSCPLASPFTIPGTRRGVPVPARSGLLQPVDDLLSRLGMLLPDGLEIPLLPASRWSLLRAILPIVLRLRQRVRANQKKLPAFLSEAPAFCEALHTQIQAASSTAELIGLWRTDLEPFFHEAGGMLEAATRQEGNGSALYMVRRDLRKLVGKADAWASPL